jgi:hypothetical protein
MARRVLARQGVRARGAGAAAHHATAACGEWNFLLI